MKETAVIALLLFTVISLSVFGAKKVAFIDQKKCIQCGSCFKKCPVKAIGKFEVNRKMHYVVDPVTCISCGNCVKICPTGSVSLYDNKAVPSLENTLKNKKAFINQSSCTHCGICFEQCPSKAIDFCDSAGTAIYTIDPVKCTACGLCVENCPSKSANLTDKNAIPKSSATLKKYNKKEDSGKLIKNEKP